MDIENIHHSITAGKMTRSNVYADLYRQSHLPFRNPVCLNFSSDASFQSRLSTCLCKPAFLYINRRHALTASKSVCKVYFPLLCIIYVLFPKTIRALAVNAVKYVSMYEWANMIYNWKFPDFICITHDIAKDSLKTFSYKYVCLFT